MATAAREPNTVDWRQTGINGSLPQCNLPSIK